MKKLLALTLVLGLFAGLLVGCNNNDQNGNGGDTDVEFADLVEAIKEKIIADLKDQGYTDDDFANEELPGYTKEEVGSDELGFGEGMIEKAVVIRAGFLNADELIVLEAKAGKANDLKALLETYQQERHEFWRDYNEMQAEKIENAIIKVQGNFVYYIVYEDAAGIDAAIGEVLK